MGFHRQRQWSPPGVLAPVLVLLARAAAGHQTPVDPAAREMEHSLVVEHDPDLSEEAGLIVELLGRKLAVHRVRVTSDDADGRRDDEDPPPGGVDPTSSWVAGLRALSADWLLLTIAGPDPSVRESTARDLRRGDDPLETARTVAIVVEEAVMPYLAEDVGRSPLGAGLAIIEPPEVGGVKASPGSESRTFPHLRCIEIGLAGLYLPATDDIIAGPRMRIEGSAAARVTVAAGLGWAGSGHFVEGAVNGTVSSVPIDVSIGAVLLPGKILDLSAAAGFSMGFVIYRTSDGDERRTDILFDPWLTMGLRAALRIHGPWALAVDGGAALVMLRDELLASGRTVYLQDWLVPRMGLALQLWL